jgi:hypothetical protein
MNRITAENLDAIFSPEKVIINQTTPFKFYIPIIMGMLPSVLIFLMTAFSEKWIYASIFLILAAGFITIFVGSFYYKCILTIIPSNRTIKRYRIFWKYTFDQPDYILTDKDYVYFKRYVDVEGNETSVDFLLIQDSKGIMLLSVNTDFVRKFRSRYWQSNYSIQLETNIF